MQSADITYQVVGSASLANQLDLRLIRNTGRGFTVTGSVSAPRVERRCFPETQAALKPLSELVSLATAIHFNVSSARAEFQCRQHGA